jgi:hypothetical protein
MITALQTLRLLQLLCSMMPHVHVACAVDINPCWIWTRATNKENRQMPETHGYGSDMNCGCNISAHLCIKEIQLSKLLYTYVCSSGGITDQSIMIMACVKQGFDWKAVILTNIIVNVRMSSR